MLSLFAAAILPAALMGMSGCGSGEQHLPEVGAITITDVHGAPVTNGTLSLKRGTAVYLDVTITHDAEFLGVDWTVTCSDAAAPGTLPPGTLDTSCGTFVPYHTISGPVPTYPGVSGIVTQFTAPANLPKDGTVTITAHATSMPSSTATLVFTIT